MSQSPREMIRLALEVASSGSGKDLPVGAIICDASGSILASSRNAVIEKRQTTAHAELQAIARVDLRALKRDAQHMTIAVTLEPCPMCAWAIRAAGIGTLIFGAFNTNYGAAGSVYDLLRDKRHGRSVEVTGGVLADECQELLVGAFLDLRNNSLG